MEIQIDWPGSSGVWGGSEETVQKPSFRRIGSMEKLNKSYDPINTPSF